MDVERNPGPNTALSGWSWNFGNRNYNILASGTLKCSSSGLQNENANMATYSRPIVYSRNKLFNLRSSAATRKVFNIPVVTSHRLRNNGYEKKEGRSRTLSLIKINKEPAAPRIVPKCMVLNARSLAKPNPTPALYAELKSNNIDICFVSQSWLNKKILSHVVCPESYVMVRKDRANYRSGGEVAVICRNDWRIEMLNNINSFDYEFVWCKIRTPNSDYYVASIYHPTDPVYDASELLDFLSHTCDQILLNDPNAKIIIAGDINQLKIREFIQQHALKQMVRVCTRGERIQDVFFSQTIHFSG